MSAINRILIPTDFSETAQLAVAHGANMAHVFNAKLFLLHSVESHYYVAGAGEPLMMPETDSIYKNADQKLNEMADDIRKKYGTEVNAIMVTGKPAASIAKAVKENNIDIIVMGTHGASGFEEYFIGSNTHKTVSLALCPVLSVQATAVKVGFTNIVVPIDNALHSRQKVNNVIEIASKYNAKVHILGLIETKDAMEGKKIDIKMEPVEHLIQKAGITYDKKIMHGHNLAVEAMKYSDEVGADLIVIMTDHESELTGMFLGTVAKQIVNHSKIPVLSIRPEKTTIVDFDPAGGTGEQ